MRTIEERFITIAITLAFAIVLPGSATAATVGQTQVTSSASCAADDELITTVVAAGPTYVVPSAGVVTKWRTHGDATDAGDTMALRVYEQQSASSFKPVFDSGLEMLAGGGVNEFPTQFSVAGGEFIGLRVGASGGDGSSCVGPLLGSGYELRINSSPPPGPVGTPESFTAVGTSRTDLEAVVEPDADGDGFGDATQDQCPGTAAYQVTPCDRSAPNTTITRAPRKRTRLRQVIFRFASSEANSNFECSLDGRAFKGCISPRILKAGLGRHLFKVRARDQTGNVDPSPAVATWKVLRKRR